jgi:phosphoribosyl 1,2-cyclic phosphodiesterase
VAQGGRGDAGAAHAALKVRVLGSGSEGNATLVEGGGSSVLLDAGLGVNLLAERLQSAGLDPERIDAVLVSHEHGDHAGGARAFSARFGVPLMGTRGTFMAGRFAEAKLPRYEAVAAGETRQVGRLLVKFLAVPHDAAGPVAFIVSCGETSFGHATDLGYLSRSLVAAFSGCDALLVESNYDPALLRDGPYPWSLKERILGPLGHLANADAARLLEKGLGARCRHVVLAHLSRRNNHPELVQMAAEEALGRARRGDVQLTLAAPEGTGWISVSTSRAAAAAERQLRLF